MKIFDLGGQWYVKKQEDHETIPATGRLYSYGLLTC